MKKRIYILYRIYGEEYTKIDNYNKTEFYISFDVNLYLEKNDNNGSNLGFDELYIYKGPLNELLSKNIFVNSLLNSFNPFVQNHFSTNYINEFKKYINYIEWSFNVFSLDFINKSYPNEKYVICNLEYLDVNALMFYDFELKNGSVIIFQLSSNLHSVFKLKEIFNNDKFSIINDGVMDLRDYFDWWIDDDFSTYGYDLVKFFKVINKGEEEHIYSALIGCLTSYIIEVHNIELMKKITKLEKENNKFKELYPDWQSFYKGYNNLLSNDESKNFSYRYDLINKEIECNFTQQEIDSFTTYLCIFRDLSGKPHYAEYIIDDGNWHFDAIYGSDSEFGSVLYTEINLVNMRDYNDFDYVFAK